MNHTQDWARNVDELESAIDGLRINLDSTMRLISEYLQHDQP